jgi:hypothetical protein
MELDVEFVLQSLTACSVPLFISAHSYATLQVIKLVTTKLEEAKWPHIGLPAPVLCYSFSNVIN